MAASKKHQEDTPPKPRALHPKEPTPEEEKPQAEKP